MEHAYDALIKQIKRKRTAVYVSTIAAILLAFILCLPLRIVPWEEPVVQLGEPAVLPLIISLLIILVIEIAVLGFILSPMVMALDAECDPEKHLILNTALNRQKDMSSVYTVDFFYMGKFEVARSYAENMTTDKRPVVSTVAFFYKARCAFFLGDFEAFRLSASQFKAMRPSIRAKQKVIAELYAIEKVLDLMLALAQEDAKALSTYHEVEAWNKNSAAARGFTDYLKGRAAFLLQDTHEAIYRFMAVKNSCSKTVLAELASTYLEKL